MIEYYKNLDLTDIVYTNEFGMKCTEIWKDIPNYEGHYQASDLGRVKSLSRYKQNHQKLQYVEDRILKQRNSIYLSIELNKNSIAKSINVHQLIAITFLNHTPCGYKLVVDHKNNIKHDNRLSNLQVITHRHNASKDKKSKSSHTGVFKIKDCYSARVYNKLECIYLGLFSTLNEAIKVYEDAVYLIEKGQKIDHLKVRKDKTTVTNVVGVHKNKNRFSACVFVKSKKKHLGTYDTIEEAKQVRKEYLENQQK